VSRHGLDAERRGEVRLAGAGPADQDEILRLLGEGGRRETGDLPAVDLRLREIEAGEIAMHRKAGDMHLVADGARGAIRGFGLHQRGQQRRGFVREAGNDVEHVLSTGPATLEHELQTTWSRSTPRGCSATTRWSATMTTRSG